MAAPSPAVAAPLTALAPVDTAAVICCPTPAMPSAAVQPIETLFVVDSMAGRLPEAVTLRDLGSVRLRDLSRPERVYQVGMRTGAREEYQRKAPHLFPAHRVRPLEAVRSLLPELRAHPLYVTIDVDVLDPSEAPGTGAPEPCGITAAELVEIIRLLAPCDVVGTDLMEVAHTWDPSGRTGITASWILREAILTWWGA